MSAEFDQYLNEFNRKAHGAGSSKGTDRYSGLDVRMNVEKGEELGLSKDEIGRGIQKYFNSLNDNVKHGGATRRELDKVFSWIDSDTPEPKVKEDNGSFNEPKNELSPQVMGAIERVAAYRDRAWSGQHAQDVFGKADALANGVPAKAGSTGTNKAGEAADLATRETYFDAEKYKRNYGEEYKASSEM